MLKICFACSKGGHYSQMKRLIKKIDEIDGLKESETFFLTFSRGNPEQNEYCVEDPERNPLKVIKTFFQTIKILSKEKPDVIISTGAGVAIPACYIGRLFGSKIIFIESYSRVTKPSLSGRLAKPISNLFFVQWPQLKEKYRNSIYAGRLR